MTSTSTQLAMEQMNRELKRQNVASFISAVDFRSTIRRTTF